MEHETQAKRIIERFPRDFSVKDFNRRNFYPAVMDYIIGHDCYRGDVAVIYGLRRTGKTTVMEQLACSLPEDMKCKFFEITNPANKVTMDEIYDILDNAWDDGINCVFIDEVTFADDFMTNSALLSDVYAKKGMRIILTGTDSLSFIFAEGRPLFGRTVDFSSTYISFGEHCRVLGTDSLDNYICHGGLMRPGDDPEQPLYRNGTLLKAKYIDEAVADNISGSIKRFPNDPYLNSVSREEMRSVIV